MKWWFISTGLVIVAGILTAFVPVETPKAEPAAQAAPARIDDRQLDAIAERVAARVTPARAEARAPATKPVWHEAPEATREQQSAADRAGQIVDEALTRRELSEGDVRSLRALGPQLQPAAQDDLRMKMIRALNRQELKLDPRAGLP